MNAANAYADCVEAVQEQRARLQQHPPDDTQWDRHASGYRFDPLRTPEPTPDYWPRTYARMTMC